MTSDDELPSNLTIAMQMERAGDLQGARDAYRRAIASGESGGGAKLALLGILEALGDDAELLELADDLDGKGPRASGGRRVVVHSAAIAIHRARALLRAGRSADAETAARDALRRLADNGGVVGGPVATRPAEAHHALGLALRFGGEPAASVPAFRAAIELEPTWAMLHFDLGVALGDMGDLVGAVAASRRATELDPNDGDGFYNLACYSARVGATDEVLAALATAIELDPANAGLAREDADFGLLAKDSRFVELVQ